MILVSYYYFCYVGFDCLNVVFDDVVVIVVFGGVESGVGGFD